MMEDKIRVVFCVNNTTGGVYSVIKNIIKFGCKNFNVKTIITTNKISNEYYNFEEHECLFEYTKNENLYSVAKRFKKLIRDKDLIIANDWLELGLISLLGLQNKVIHILHGDYPYYYELAHKHTHIIDKYVCVSEHISLKLIDSIPDRKNDILYLPHPIPDVFPKEKFNIDKPLRCIFIGRLIEDKGFNLLPKIDAHLKSNNVIVEWTIIADTSNFDNSVWEENQNVSYAGLISNETLLSNLKNFDLFILPSKAEGFPVSLVETMKAAIVPLVSDLPSGVPELVYQGETGFRLPIDDYQSYCETILYLNKNRTQLEKIGMNAKDRACRLFDPYVNGTNYSVLILNTQVSTYSRKKSRKTFGSRLDQPYYPNFLVKLLRSF